MDLRVAKEGEVVLVGLLEEADMVPGVRKEDGQELEEVEGEGLEGEALGVVVTEVGAGEATAKEEAMVAEEVTAEQLLDSGEVYQVKVAMGAGVRVAARLGAVSKAEVEEVGGGGEAAARGVAPKERVAEVRREVIHREVMVRLTAVMKARVTGPSWVRSAMQKMEQPTA